MVLKGVNSYALINGLESVDFVHKSVDSGLNPQI